LWGIRAGNAQRKELNRREKISGNKHGGKGKKKERKEEKELWERK